MENKKMGTGILTISIFYLVSLLYGINRSIASLQSLDMINEISTQVGLSPITSTEVIFTIILNIVTLIGIVIILFRKKIGVYIFFGTVPINIISLLIINGFKQSTIVSSLLSLILPSLLAYFIYKRNEIFGFNFIKVN